ncbi:MAG: hypothetical protein ACM3NH_01365 [Candidatus Saccharibacteria bacterium]
MLIEPSSPLWSAVSLVFYVIMAIFVFASMVSLYSLIKYGKSKFIILFVSGAYVIAMFTLLSLALEQFSKLTA